MMQVFSEKRELGKPCWCHLECRQAPETMLQMAKAWLAAAPADEMVPLSLEVAKPSSNPETLAPLLQTCHYAFFSREFIEAYHANLLKGQVQEVAAGKGMDWDW